jgi:hypothetical protein
MVLMVLSTGRPGEVKEEGDSIRQVGRREDPFLAHPTLRPLRKITTIATVWQQRGGRRWGRIEIRLHLRIDPVNSCAFPEF